MSRSVEEWRGKTDDEAPPPRVRFRVLITFGRVCAGCSRPIRPSDAWTCDHKIALINGGENRERNLQPLCGWCNPTKNAADVAEKSKTYRMGRRHAGIRKSPSRPMPGTKASGIRKRMNGHVEPWR